MTLTRVVFLCGVLFFILAPGTGCGDGGGPQMDTGMDDVLLGDDGLPVDVNGQELVVNPDAVDRDLAGTDLAGTDTAGTDTGVGEDGSDPEDTTVTPQCTDSAQCAFGNICIDTQCVPGCNGDRDCPGDQRCDTDALPHGACLDCIEDNDCDTVNDQKCRNGVCVASCTTNDECDATPSTPFCETTSELCVQCLADGSCPEGHLCLDYACVVGCRGDRDCPEGLRCDPKVAPNGDCFTCVADSDCNGKVCKDHECVVDCSAIKCMPDKPVCDPATGNCLECMGKADCGQGFLCLFNDCVPGCENDVDCLGDLKCAQGSCVECTIDDDCTGDQKCRSNTCSDADCYRDSDCDSGYYCHPLLYSCEDLPNGYCTADSDCTSIFPGFGDDYCDPLTRECIPSCMTSLGIPLCLDLTGTGRNICVDDGCYGCATNYDCPGVRCSPYDRFCHACVNDSDCAVPGWHCADSGSCYECINDFQCTYPEVCDEAGGNACVECLTSDDCTNGAKPVCGKSKTCIAACQDECTSGQQICNPDDTTEPITMLSCGDYDDDPCKEYGGYVSCGYGASCETQSDQGECVCTNECSANTKWCATGETDVTETCVQDQSSGCWYISTNYCGTGEVCDGGVCECTNECAVDQSVCKDTKSYLLCVEDYYSGCPYWTTYNCNSGYYCYDGDCQ